MALKEIKVDGQPILVEVTDLPVEAGEGGQGGGDFEYTAAPADMGERVSGLVGVLTAPIQRALAAAQAAEWTLEVTMGFKGETGLPFIAKGEANGAVKVTARWTKES